MISEHEGIPERVMISENEVISKYAGNSEQRKISEYGIASESAGGLPGALPFPLVTMPAFFIL